MTTQTVSFCTTSSIPSCQNTYPREAIFCVPEVLTASGMPFLSGTLTNIQKLASSCGTCVYKYTLEYDDADLIDPTTPLTPPEVSNLFCKDCLTTWIEELTAGASCIEVSDTSSLNLTIEPGDPCSTISGNVLISADEGNIVEIREDGLFASQSSGLLTGWSTDEEGDFNQELGFDGDIVYRSATFGIQGIDDTTASVNFPANGDLNLLSGSQAGCDVNLDAANATGAINFKIDSVIGWSVNSSYQLVQDVTNGSSLIMSRDIQSVLLGISSVDSDITSVAGVLSKLTMQGNSGTGFQSVNVQVGANTSGAMYASFKTRATDGSANTAVNSGDAVAYWYGYASDGTTYDPCAGIVYKVDSTLGVGVPGNITFQTSASGAAALLDRWSIDRFGQLLQDGTNGNDIVFAAADAEIRYNTSDGSDIHVLTVCGGGGFASSRGASIAYYGNEGDLPGALILNSGDVAAAAIGLNAPNATGYVSIAMVNLERWRFNASGQFAQDATNGGDIVFSLATAGVVRHVANSGKLQVSGGSAPNVASGAFLSLGGATNATPGEVSLLTADVAGALLRLRAYNATGALTFEVATAEKWRINASGQFLQDATNGSDIVFTKATTAIQLQSGANGRTGTFSINGSTPVTVNNTSLAAGDQIIISRDTPAGTPGLYDLTARTNGASFEVTGTALDTSGMRYTLIRIN